MAIEHMVWIRFNEGLDPERIEQHLQSLRSLKDRVPGIRHLAVGPNITDRADGYTHGLLVRLDSPESLHTYQSHPEHVKVAVPLKQDAHLKAMDIEYNDKA